MCDKKSQPQAVAAHVSAEAAECWLRDVVEPQRAWYDGKAQRAKFWHVALSAVQLIGTASIPVVNSITHSVAISSVIAGIAAIATGFAQLLRHHDQWLNYRAAAVALENVQRRYAAGLPPYNGQNRHDLFVAEFDRIAGNEGGRWLASAQKKPRATPLAPNQNASDE